MRLLTLFILGFSVAYGQVEVRFINPDGISDPGVQNILATYNVQYIEPKGCFPIEGLDNIYQINGLASESAISGLVSELSSYTSVVQRAAVADPDLFADCCNAQISNAAIGIPIGFNGNIVETNDTGLNAIFQSFNVYYYAQAYPSSTWEGSQRVYNVACNCNSVALQTALENYSSVVEMAELIPACYLAMGVGEQELSAVKVYPNPFTSTINIDSNAKIVQYDLMDTVGKLVCRANNLADLNKKLSGLNSGVYLLQLQSDKSQIETRKIVKL